MIELTPTWWIPDYLHGSLRHWSAPQPSNSRSRGHAGDQVIHCVGRFQHFLDAAFGRLPRSRCGILLAQSTPTALLDDGAPLCQDCAVITHPTAAQVEVFNHRCGGNDAALR